MSTPTRVLLALFVWAAYSVLFIVDGSFSAFHSAEFLLVPVALSTWWIGRWGVALSVIGVIIIHVLETPRLGEGIQGPLFLLPTILGVTIIGFVSLWLRKEHEKNRFRSEMLDAVDEAVVATDPNGKVLYWNPAAERLYGWKSQEAIGRNITTLTPSETTAAQATDILHSLQKGERWSGEFQVRRKDGSTFPAWVSDVPLVTSSGRLQGIIGISRDLTPEKQRRAREHLYVEREKEMQRLIEVSRYKTEFLNSAAHELMTPLTPVTLQLDLLMAGKHGPLTERQQGVVATVERNIKALEHTLQEMVDAAQAQKAPVALRLERTDLAEEAALTASHYAPLASRAGLQLHVLAMEPVVIQGDPSSLHKVMSALVDNAIRYSEPDGHVWIRVDADETAARVQVEDDGAGIPAEDAGLVFEPYGRSRAEDLRRGPGLGLYVARHLVEAHGGTIWHEPRQGGGTRFTFTIPLQWSVGNRAGPPDPMRETSASVLT